MNIRLTIMSFFFMIFFIITLIFVVDQGKIDKAEVGWMFAILTALFFSGMVSVF